MGDGDGKDHSLPSSRLKNVRGKWISLCFCERPSETSLNKARCRTVSSLSPPVLNVFIHVHILPEEKVRNKIMSLF